jgi:hypothetical protein
LPDDVYDAVTRVARASGQSPEEWIAADLSRLIPNGGDETPQRPLPKELYQVLQQEAARLGRPLDDVIAEYRATHAPKPRPELTEEALQAARERFERHFGAVNLGHPTGADNESIDADLAREYGDTHQEAP